MQCTNCGKEIPNGTEFCIFCGASQNKLFNPSDTLLGTIVAGRYEIKRVLGRGGMGVVYLAYDRELREEIALKTLPREFAYDTRAIADMRSEVKVARSLSHHNIVRVHDFGKDGDLVFITMEYVKGDNLSEILAKRGELPLNVVVMIAEQACEALDYAHRNKVIHRDIKPSNLMITGDGVVKVMDFGIARTIKETHGRISKTRVAGAPVYMSPEQYKGRDITYATDIYSLSATLYELLAGHPPFYRGNIEYQILNEPPEPIEGVSEEVNGAILCGLAKEPEDRPDTAGELLSGIEGKVGVIVSKPKKIVEDKEPVPVKGRDVDKPVEKEYAGVLPKKKSGAGKFVGVAFASIAVISLAIVLIWGFATNWGKGHYQYEMVEGEKIPEEEPIEWKEAPTEEELPLEEVGELEGFPWEKYAEEKAPLEEEPPEEEPEEEREYFYEEQISCWLEVSPNPASIPEKYTVNWVVDNRTNKDITVYYIMDDNSRINVNVTAPAGSTTVVKSASGTTYIPGVFHHVPTFYTSEGAIRAPNYDFVVK